MTPTTLSNIFDSDDLYELILRGYTIVRITRFRGGTSFRELLEYKELPESVKTKVLAEVSKHLNDEE